MRPGFPLSTIKSLRIIVFISISCTFLILPHNQVVYAGNIYKNSCGIITFYFDPVKIKIYNEKKQTIGYATLTKRICNGFLVKHENQIYFLTIAIPARVIKDGALLPYDNNLFYEILEDRKGPAEVAITPAQAQEEIRMTLDKKNSASGNTVREKRRVENREEKIDLLCINVTGSLRAPAEPILGYEQLAGESDKLMLDKETQIVICGYPAAKIEQGYRVDPTTITSPGTFATLTSFNHQEISGFSFAFKPEKSDAGRPVCATANGQDMTIGIVKEVLSSDTGEYIGGIAIDSTAIRRIIDALHKKTRQDDTKEINAYGTRNP